MIRLPPLTFARNALEPAMSGATVDLHHGKHHAKYVAVVNSLIEARGLELAPLESILRAARADGPEALLANAGQAWNHGFFWQSLTPDRAAPGPRLLAAVDAAGGYEALGRRFVEAGSGHFGSGWVWLVVEDNVLSVRTTHDGETLAESGSVPLLVCDLWEHAYYLDYQNDRAGFLAAFWSQLANWRFAERQLTAAQSGAVSWEYRDSVVIDPNVDLEDAIATAEWRLAHPPEGPLDVARRHKVAQELEQRVAALAEPASFAERSDDLGARIRRMSDQLRKDPPEGQHWPILPAF
jgi:Fe-Mn family superoxide dismutase